MGADEKPAVDPFDSRPLPAILTDLSVRRATGELSVLVAGGRRLVRFRDGRLRAARSTIERERLGAWLTARDRIRESELALVLLAQAGPARAPLGRLLLDRGLIDQPTLERELEELGLAILGRATTEPRRRLGFERDPDPRQPDTLPDHATARLILAAARMLDPQRETPRLLTDAGRSYRTAGPPAELANRLDATADERRVLHALARPRTLGELGTARLMPEPALQRALLPLIMCGAVVPSGHGLEPPVAPRLAVRSWSDPELVERSIVVQFAKEMADRGHYAVLGLEPGASYADVEAAWSRLAAQLDPGRASRSAHLADLRAELELAYERVRTAYETLIDPTSRVAYNRIHHADRLQGPSRRGSVRGPRRTTQDAARHAIVAANLRRAEQALRTGDRHTAYTLLEAACALEPKPESLVRLARVMISNPMWSERALARLKQALELDPWYVEAWLELAAYWRRRHRPDRERRALLQALTVEPGERRAADRLEEMDRTSGPGGRSG